MKKQDLICTVAFVVLMWGILWECAAAADRAECEAHFLRYGYTSVFLDGYCLAGETYLSAWELSK